MTKNWLLRDNLLFSLLKVNIVWGCDLKAIHFIINHGGLPAQCAHCGLVGECSRVHTGVLSQNACGWVVCFHKVFSCLCGCVGSPVSVSVVVMCEWQQAALFPEGPGPCRRPASSSYTVYTKLCMYKIEKSAKENKKHGRMSDINQQFLNPQIMSKKHRYTMLLQQSLKCFHRRKYVFKTTNMCCDHSWALLHNHEYCPYGGCKTHSWPGVRTALPKI